MTKAEQAIIDAYEQNKHLDHLLSDREWLDHTITDLILADLWTVVKAYAEIHLPVAGNEKGFS